MKKALTMVMQHTSAPLDAREHMGEPILTEGYLEAPLAKTGSQRAKS